MKSRRSMSVILLAIFLDLISYGILIPVVPQLLANPDSPYYLLPSYIPVESGYIILGFLIATFPLIQFFSAPVLGEYSDYVGRRRILALALVGSGVSLAVFAFGVTLGSLSLLFFSRVLGGLSGGFLSVAQAAIADVTPPRERAKNFGLIGAAYGIGLILGPVIGALLSDADVLPWFNAATPFWFAACMSFANALLVYYFMRETRIPSESRVISWYRAIHNVIRAYGMKKLRPIFATNFLFQASVAFFATFLSVFLIYKFGFDQSTIGYYIAYVGVWVVITQAVVLPFFTKRWGSFSILRVSLFLGSVAIFSYYLPTALPGLLIVGALFALANGVNMANIPSLVSTRASADEQGEILGVNGSVQAIAQAVPPVLAGFLAAKIAPVAPVYISGAVIGLGWLVFLIFVKRNPD